MRQPELLDAWTYHPALDALAGAALVVFTAPGCGACRALRRALATGPDPGFSWRWFEVDAATSAGLVADLEIFHLPAMFLYAEGDYYAEVHAPPRPDDLAAAMAAARAGPRGDPP